MSHCSVGAAVEFFPGWPEGTTRRSIYQSAMVERLREDTLATHEPEHPVPEGSCSLSRSARGDNELTSLR